MMITSLRVVFEKNVRFPQTRVTPWIRLLATEHGTEHRPRRRRFIRVPLPSAVRSWQKPLAGAVRRIRCHSHPRMLHHHSPDHDPLLSLLLLLIFSFPLRRALLSLLFLSVGFPSHAWSPHLLHFQIVFSRSRLPGRLLSFSPYFSPSVIIE